jgi:hypothetical protein
MSFERIGGVFYCSERDCGAMFTAADDKAFQAAMKGEPLPCGHKAEAVILSARHIKGGDDACAMLDWLIERDYIDTDAFLELDSLGGKLDDGLNCRVPEE